MAAESEAFTVTLSFGRNVRDVRPTTRTITFHALVKEFSVPDTQRSKLTSAQYHALDKKGQHAAKDGRYFSVATYRQDGTRQEKDVEFIHGFALDFDSGRTNESDVRETLGGLSYIAYTSYSHRPDRERWRVYIPFKEPISMEQFKAVYEHFQFLFGGDLDGKCESPQQPWYTPACPHDAVKDFRFFYEVGELFDANAVRPAVKKNMKPSTKVPTVPLTTSTELTRLKVALKYIDSDDRQAWIEVGLAIKHDLGDAGLTLWLEWSARSPKFEEEEALATWGSFKPREPGEPAVTRGTVFHMAKQAGWVDDTVPDYIAKLNEEFFVAPIGRHTLIFREHIEPVFGHRTVTPMKKEDFRLLFANRFVEIAGGKRVNIAEAWVTHLARREYLGVVLSPNGDLPGYYNRWRGLAVEPVKGRRAWKRMRWHIRYVICGGNRELYRYVFDWLAYCVQHPGDVAGVALVLRGGRGTGKGMFVVTFGSLFGPHFLHITHSRHLVGHFNAPLADCSVLFVDEAHWAGDKAGENVLKGYVTEPTICIERKGIDAETQPNRLKIIIASNNDWVVPAGIDERRYCVIDVSDIRKQDTVYFGQLKQEIDSGGREAMLYDLLHRDLSRFNIRKVPNTEALKGQKILSLDPAQQWWFDRLQEGEWPYPHNSSWSLVPKSTVHDDYVGALKKAGVQRRASETALGMALRNLLPNGWKMSTKMQSPAAGTARVPAYQFPPLADCRAHFEKLTGMEGWDWS